jgi:acyl carrier protein
MIDESMPARGEVEAVVVRAIASALDREPGEIALSGSLEDDYEAQSIDFLEIVFSLERAFRIRMPKTNLIEHAQVHFGEGEFARQGELTELGVAVLRQMRPEIGADEFRVGLKARDVGRLVTPQTFVRLVVRLLEAKWDARRALRDRGCQRCGSHDIGDSASAPEFVCRACGMSVLTPSGDEVLMQDLASLPIRNGS